MSEWLDELSERVLQAREKLLDAGTVPNTVVLNEKKYAGRFDLISPRYAPTIFGLRIETAPLQEGCEFVVLRREPKPKTRADKIRSMTDEELAERFAAPRCPRNGSHNMCDGEGEVCVKCWLDWLREEAQE